VGNYSVCTEVNLVLSCAFIQLASYTDKVEHSLEHSAIFLYDVSKINTQLQNRSER